MYSKILYLNKRCAQVKYIEFRRYAYLGIDLVFCDGSDLELREKMFNIIKSYWDMLRTYMKRKKIREIYDFFFFRSSCREFGCYLPYGGDDYVRLGIGNTIIAFRIPIWMAQQILRYDRFVEVVKDWCESRGLVGDCDEGEE